jgi:hypothetical protein
MTLLGLTGENSTLWCNSQASAHRQAPVGKAETEQQPKFSFSPGSGHCITPKRPESENVMYAVRMSAPPKQMLVGYTSGILTARTRSPWGENSVI